MLDSKRRAFVPSPYSLIFASVYLISTAIANQIRAKTYDEDLPSLENDLCISLPYFFFLQLINAPLTGTLQTNLLPKFTSILQHTQALQLTHHDHVQAHLAGIEVDLLHSRHYL